MIIELQSTYTAVKTYPITINNNACITPVNNLTISPAAGTVSPLTITSANTTATIDINGGKYITINKQVTVEQVVTNLLLLKTQVQHRVFR